MPIISSFPSFVPAAPLRNGSPAKVSAAMKNAVETFGKSKLADFGASFSAATYPASKSLEEVLADEAGLEFDDEFTTDDAFEHRASGKNALKEMLSDIGNRGVDAKDTVDGDPEPYDDMTGDEAQALYDAVADAAVSNFAPGTEFQAFEYFGHDIAEDGDTTRRLLVGHKNDGTWLVLSFSDFPF